MRRRMTSLLAVTVVGAGFFGCGGDDSGEAGSARDSTSSAVTIKTFIYDPNPIEVEAGTKVRFTNEDDILHTVTEGTKDDPVKGGFDLQLDGAGTTGDVTFDEPGTIRYTCTIHQGMDAKAVVSE